ncbi:hypothetical protein F5Y18DRAFT_212006 [Xylariaceae sp. FL1019]|nr:hypothetical protein F5Y18DRAFT_212006 [Xylariaceae sp. FL1019]
MEQDSIPDKPNPIPSSQNRRSHSSSRQLTPRLAYSEPSCPPLHTTTHQHDDLSDSVPTLRFPRPLGNRQLSNWISSSQHDIMQAGEHFSDDELSLSEMGYDVVPRHTDMGDGIGYDVITDDESAAESTASSFDYQRPGEVHSYAGTEDGTDVDIDSDDGEDAGAMNETTISDATLVEGAQADDAQADDLNGAQESGITAIHSVENPLTLSLSGFIPLPSTAYAESHRPQDPSEAEVKHVEDSDIADTKEVGSSTPAHTKPSKSSDTRWPKSFLQYETLRVAFNHIYQNRIVAGLLVGLVVQALVTLALRPVLFGTSIPKELSTVPVASVASVAQPSSAGGAISLVTSSSTSLQTPKALQTVTSSTALVSIPFGSDKTDLVITTGADHLCAAELFSRNEILVRIPQNLKDTWLAKDAIVIAVSRDLKDIPTTVSSVDEGFLIEVPMTDAHGVLAVAVATTRKPKVNEYFRVNFGTHRLTGALDAGKQLVRGFAQKVADTVNDTTTWVEETYSIPALDTVSKQVCEQTVSVSGSIQQSITDLSVHVQSVGRNVATRGRQLELAVTGTAQDIRDDLQMRLLKSQINSKLLWLKAQGKMDEHEQYLSKAEVYWAEQRAEKESARILRAEQTKKEIQASPGQSPAQPEAKGFFGRLRGKA